MNQLIDKRPGLIGSRGVQINVYKWLLNSIQIKARQEGLYSRNNDCHHEGSDVSSVLFHTKPGHAPMATSRGPHASWT